MAQAPRSPDKAVLSLAPVRDPAGVALCNNPTTL